MAKLISQQTNRHQRAKIELNENRINRWLAEGPWGGGTRYQYLRRASNRRIKRQLRVASKSRMRPRHLNQGFDPCHPNQGLHPRYPSKGWGWSWASPKLCVPLGFIQVNKYFVKKKKTLQKRILHKTDPD